jgi:adenylate kinase family enzyme
VIGRSGAGKTTVAVAVASALGVPVVHLDRLHWGPGWTPVGSAAFEAAHARAVEREAWVIDGGYLASVGWPQRAARADLVLIVEAPLAVCLARIVRRSLAPRDTRRPDLPDGCSDGFSLALVGWTVTWSRRTRGARRALETCAHGTRVVRVEDVDGALAALGVVPLSGGAARAGCR